jgi:hypothetical protein
VKTRIGGRRSTVSESEDSQGENRQKTVINEQ